MPKTVIEEKCANCGRTLYGTDFLQCPACEGNGFTLETVNECCGHGTPSGDCCGDPVPGQEQVGCERCQTTGKVATPPAPEDTDG